jgi:acyl dehydratase
MTETECLTAAMLEVGTQFEAKMSFTREQVERYCTLSGDWNAIHRDLDAAKLRFPGVKDIVVPGGLVQISITGIFGSRFPGDGTLGLTFTPERMRKPVCPGDEILVVIEVTRIKGPILEVDIRIDDEEGNRIGNAQSKMIAPDDTYRQWWEKQRHS